jgi:mRNA interferase MazF
MKKEPKKILLVKRFGAWNKLKYKIHFDNSPPRGYKERDVWWLSMGHNVGAEEDGKGDNFSRPIIVIKGFNKHLLWGIPISTADKTGIYYHKVMVNGEPRVAILSQLKAYSTKRLINKVGVIDVKSFEVLKKRLLGLF